MSSNQLGAIEVAVESEGVDETADDISGVAEDAEDGDGLDLGGGGGDGDGGGMGQRLGRLGRVLGVIASLIAVLGPMLEFIKAISGVLQAFLAPLSLMLMRLLMPVLRIMLRLLPGWLKFMENPEKWTALITDKIVSELVALPGKMVRKLKSVLGIGGGGGGGGGDFTFPQRVGLAAAGIPTAGVVPLLASLLERLDRGGSGRDRGPGGGPRITFQGGVGTLLERVETDNNVDLP